MPFLSKIFKELLLNRIRQHLQTKSTISMHQFGFREKHGTIEQVTIEAKRLGYATHLKNGSNAPQFFCVSPRLFKILFPQNIHAITESYLQQKSFEQVNHKTTKIRNAFKEREYCSFSVCRPFSIYCFHKTYML